MDGVTKKVLRCASRLVESVQHAILRADVPRRTAGPFRRYTVSPLAVAAADAPEVALYQSERHGSGWSAPLLMPFAGVYQDYEPAVSPDGRVMIFNSHRPLPDGTPISLRRRTTA
jgi:hypothetical protein